MGLLSVEEALGKLLFGAAPSGVETVSISECADRVLAEPLKALRTHPPFPASAMDGYAVHAADLSPGAKLAVIGTAPAGAPFEGGIRTGQAVRIFTGAPVPDGADTILIQENAKRLDERTIEVLETVSAGRHIRRAGLDFVEGDTLLDRGRVLDAAALSLAAAANHGSLRVFRRPLVAIIATGDELLPPGSELGPGQIVASNSYGTAAIARAAGAAVLDLGIVPDRHDEIAARVEQAQAAKADIVVTLGGASVGDHDLVNQVLTAQGMTLEFWRIAMRPGKPLMFGRLGRTSIMGLPGNPVSSLICAHIFLKPLVAKLAGRPADADIREAVLGSAMADNDQRQDYVRASVSSGPGGLVASPFSAQDSSMLRVLADANGLIIRPPGAPAAPAGTIVPVLMLR
ncbi:molybdopterin molybdotransferase MoeA [Mesorhizobium sp. BAC0120]|uniref:molybdopterin molybdotransferase MoeA n=1 Tax=Mesorhizobium sp. BAC0120 TaxID=3090670 RepID=UPI00298D5145|nr:gephyrin-like molybdotransferase Glp [Mesorhizobium sp. BAC0120]MDW6022831.1 molybdopterin molybdotransferase MoeA [Mesorhizobium sp. BAC0120]